MLENQSKTKSDVFRTDCVSCQGLNRERVRRAFLTSRHGLRAIFNNATGKQVLTPLPMPEVPKCNHAR